MPRGRARLSSQRPPAAWPAPTLFPGTLTKLGLLILLGVIPGWLATYEPTPAGTGFSFADFEYSGTTTATTYTITSGFTASGSTAPYFCSGGETMNTRRLWALLFFLAVMPSFLLAPMLRAQTTTPGTTTAPTLVGSWTCTPGTVTLSYMSNGAFILTGPTGTCTAVTATTPPPPAVTVCTLPFADSFARPNGTLGANWTSAAAIQISNDAVTVPAYNSGHQTAYVAGCTFTNSQYAQMTLTSVDVYGHFGGIVSGTSAGSYYVDCTTGGGCTGYSGATYLGAFADSKGNAVVPAVGSTFCVELDAGSTLKFMLNGVYSATTFPVSGVALGTAGLEFGTQSTSPAVLSNFSAGSGKCPVPTATVASLVNGK